MDATFIIFRKSPAQSNPIWVETVEGFEKGKRRLLEYRSTSSDDFYLFDVKQARILDVLAQAKGA